MSKSWVLEPCKSKKAILKIELKLQEKIKPYASSFIGNTNPDDTGGRTPNNDPNNENTVKSKTTDGNSTPSTL
jgi:hypothetical protein